MNMNILIVSPNYPSKGNNTFTFVKQIVDEFSRMGHNCLVLSPYGYHPIKCFFSHKTIKEQDGNVNIVRPSVMLFPLLYIYGFAFSQMKFVNWILNLILYIVTFGQVVMKFMIMQSLKIFLCLLLPVRAL